MNKQILRFTLYAIMVYLTCGTLNPAIVASQPSWGNGTHYCGVTDVQSSKQHSDQFRNRHYARTSAANLNVGEPRTVRIIYLVPSDRAPAKDIDTKLDMLIRDVQQFYAEHMENHGFGRKKTFRFETDATGKAMVHHIHGRFTAEHYGFDEGKIWNEINEHFDLSKNVYLGVINKRYCGTGSTYDGVGRALIGTSCFIVPTVAHELGHAFGLLHDFRNNIKLIPTSHIIDDKMLTSFCAAEWLEAHPYFNFSTGQTTSNQNTVIKILSSSLASSPYEIRLRFEVTDNDGLHQAQLLTEFQLGNYKVPQFPYDTDTGLIACKPLNGKNATVEFVTPLLTKGSGKIVTLKVMDEHGNFTSRSFPINITALLHPPEVVSVPDPNLAAAVQALLGLAHGDTITQLDMLKLWHFYPIPGKNIMDFTGLEHATNLNILDLYRHPTRDIRSLIRAIAGLIHLQELRLTSNQIVDVSSLAALSHLTRLRELRLTDNQITDVSDLAELTNLIKLWLDFNQLTNISPLAGLVNLRELRLASNQINDVSPLSDLINLTQVNLQDNSISDLSPLVTNMGLGNGGKVDVRRNPLNYTSIYTHIPILRSRGVIVEFDNRIPTLPLKISGDNQQGAPSAVLDRPFVVEVRDGTGALFEGVPVTFTVTAGGGVVHPETVLTDENGNAESTLTLGFNAGTNTVRVSVEGIARTVTFNAVGESIEFDLSVPSDYSLIHVPLTVTAVDGVAKTITSIGDLYDVLGGANAVKLLLTLDSQTQEWFAYVSPSDRGTPTDRELTDDMGIFADMRTPASVRLTGRSLGTNGNSTITLNPSYNLVGLPLRDSRLTHVSDLFALEGIGGNAPVVIFTDNGAFKAVVPAGGPDDIPIIGGQAFILDAQQAATVTISGDGWTNTSRTAAAPPLSLTGIEVRDTTLVLGLSGSIVDEETGLKVEGFRVTVKNLSTDRAVAAVTAPDEAGYRLTIVDIETGRAATIGDTLEISAQSPNPFIGVEPLRYTITAEDVKRSRIQLPELVAYEIPAETQLLPNYPNPFNPETWIPYRLAEDAFVTLTVYDLNGQAVRTIDVGHQTAAVYESRSKAIYWDGRNGLGEQVASGVYFYHLSAGDYSATRKMLILK